MMRGFDTYVTLLWGVDCQGARWRTRFEGSAIGRANIAQRSSCFLTDPMQASGVRRWRDLDLPECPLPGKSLRNVYDRHGRKAAVTDTGRKQNDGLSAANNGSGRCC